MVKTNFITIRIARSMQQTAKGGHITFTEKHSRTDI